MCQGRPITDTIRRAIIRMRRAGASMRQIAATLGVSLPTVWKVVNGQNTA